MIEILYIPKTSFSFVVAVHNRIEIPEGFTRVCGFHGGELEISFAILNEFANKENGEIVYKAVITYIDREILL
ncbi:MAG: hypothetical protein Q8L41_04245 [Anaerolineales bacterium]|nr:hypothetical protein [Anaerolineales bacterium]